MEAMSSSETSVLTRATRRTTQKTAFFLSFFTDYRKWAIQGAHKGSDRFSTDTLRSDSCAYICACSELEEQACRAIIRRHTTWSRKPLQHLSIWPKKPVRKLYYRRGCARQLLWRINYWKHPRPTRVPNPAIPVFAPSGTARTVNHGHGMGCREVCGAAN
jgi:hypothetical protein